MGQQGWILRVERLLADWRMYGALCRLLLLVEAVLCAVIVLRVPCAWCAAWAARRELRVTYATGVPPHLRGV